MSVLCRRCMVQYPTEEKNNIFELNKRGVPHKTCKYCRTKDTSYKFNLIKQEMLKRDIECLSTEFKTGSVKMNWRCMKCNLEWEQSYRSIKAGYGCKKCRKWNKITLETVQNLVEQKGFECLDATYESARTKMNFRCNTCKNEWTTNYTNIKLTKVCPFCVRKKPYTLEEVKRIGMERGFILLSDEYLRSDFLLDWKCKECDYTWSATLS